MFTSVFKYSVSLFVIAFLFCSCNNDPIKGREEVVVEGWIENGQSPVVILSKTFTVSTEKETDSDETIVLPWGKVTVSDGEKSVVLTGQYDERYTPPYIYTTSNITGKPGQTYYLTVEYGNRKLTAQTTIPFPDSLQDIRAERCEDSDSLYQITATFRDNPLTTDYYMFMTRVLNKDSRYYPAYMGIVSDENLETENVRMIHPGIHTITDIKHKYEPYFKLNDTVLVKFTKLDETSYNIHKVYNELVILSFNPLFSNDIALPSNIKGGLGFWCGYATTNYRILPPSE